MFTEAIFIQTSDRGKYTPERTHFRNWTDLLSVITISRFPDPYTDSKQEYPLFFLTILDLTCYTLFYTVRVHIPFVKSLNHPSILTKTKVCRRIHQNWRFTLLYYATFSRQICGCSPDHLPSILGSPGSPLTNTERISKTGKSSTAWYGTSHFCNEKQEADRCCTTWHLGQNTAPFGLPDLFAVETL